MAPDSIRLSEMRENKPQVSASKQFPFYRRELSFLKPGVARISFVNLLEIENLG